MPDAPLPNSPEARTPTGEIKPPETTTDQTTKPPTTSESPPAPEDSSDKGESSLLNKDEKKAPEGAPEAYEPFKVPEGFELDEAVAKEAGELFKKHNLPQAVAQELVDFYTKKVQAVAEEPYNAYDNMRKSWRDAVAADPALKDMAKIKENYSRALDAIGDPALATEFRKIMDLTGAGDNPHVIKVINKLAGAFTEGRHVSGRGPSPLGQGKDGKAVSAASAMYPNLANNS